MSVEISFVIPAYNESKFIDRCLESITTRIKKYGLEAEVLLVDNGSTDDTALKGKRLGALTFSIGRQTVSKARNFGASKASHELIAFIDGDVELTDEWVETLIKNYKGMIRSPLFVTGAQCSVPNDGSWIEKYWFAHLRDKYLGGANVLTTKSAFNLIGGFDEDLETGEDYDFCLRAIAESSIFYTANDKFKSIHLGFPQDLANFYRREKWHGRGDVVNFSAAMHSPVVLIACVYSALVIAMVIALCAIRVDVASYILSALIGINLALTRWRFRRTSLSVQALLGNSFLHFVYFYARLMSLFSKTAR